VRRNSILGELGWLAYFLIALVLAVYAMNIFVVPHHFNDKVADVLAGIFAALLFIATRAYAARVRR
jgi:branched-subunit amino acid transport protein